GHPGVIHEDIDLSEIGQNLCPDLLYARMIANIDGVCSCRTRTFAVDLIGGSLRVCLISTHTGDLRSVAGKTHSDCMPDPPPCAGYNRSLIFKFHGSRAKLATARVRCRAGTLPRKARAQTLC